MLRFSSWLLIVFGSAALVYVVHWLAVRLIVLYRLIEWLHK